MIDNNIRKCKIKILLKIYNVRRNPNLGKTYDM